MEIKIGIGLDQIKFGMDRNKIQQLLGEPTEKELFSYSEDEDDLTEVWHYDDQELSLSFDEADDWRLIMIAGSDESFKLNGKEVVGKSLDEVAALIKEMGHLDFEVEEVSEKDKVIKLEEESLNIWFDLDEASELQWGPKWSDDNTPIFPA
ncbi:outer membrane protein assembly factor BamE [Parvicella tangerina]|uniref:Uncharacterized protein n=1 Tax=Parvicella tangerina TaxID=2829795 RepID=A0A916N956_9FLAO|nr:outer membrane protein assembly factor BamE [Parvicella tangerina]CAG5078269.1 hypothetical protein CRYO30217_00626 [Parvicella tangerina]